MSRVHRSEKTAKKLTWEGLRTHKYLKELYASIPGLKRSPDPYSPDEEGDSSAASEEAISPETQDPLDNIEELKKMDKAFSLLDREGKLAYWLTFGYGTYRYEKEKYSDADVSEPSTRESSEPPTVGGFGAFLPYAAAKQYSVSFADDELSRSEVAELYIEPIFGRGGVSLEEHDKEVRKPWLPSPDWPSINGERETEVALHILVHSFLTRILHSILGLSVFQNRLASHAFDFLIGKNVFSKSDLRSDRQSRSAEYSNPGGTSLKTLGLNVKPKLVIGVQSQNTNGTNLGVIAASLLGEVKFCDLELRANFSNVKRLLEECNSIFFKAMSAEETPDLAQLTGHDGERFRGICEGFIPFRARKRWPSFTDDDIATTGVSRYDFFEAVKLYSIITKLVTTGVHAGVPRVLLMDFNDYLFIDLDCGFVRDVEVRTDQFFPEMVNCRYAMFHRSEEFIKALILGWSLPTKEYCRDIEQFRKAVQEVSVMELREKLITLDLGGEPSTEWRPTPAHHPKNPSPSSGDSLVTVSEDDVEDPDQSSTPLTCMSSSSSQEATSSQPDPEVNRRKRSNQVIEVISGNTEKSDMLSLSPPSPAYTKRKLRKIGPQSQAFTTEYFVYRKAACQYYSCVILADALKQYVRHREGYNSQTLLVNTDLFLKNIRNSNKVFEAPAGTSLLKVYDAYWADASNSDPKDVFYHYNPIVSDLFKVELKAYEKLSPLMGEVIPTLYAYGTMLDVSVMVGQVYSRFTGPFLLMEHLKKKEGFKLSDVDEEFVENKIIPAFKRLHSLGVVHYDIKWDNMVVTEDGDFKIIDFGQSKITDDEKKFKEEIDDIWSLFKSVKR